MFGQENANKRGIYIASNMFFTTFKSTSLVRFFQYVNAIWNKK